MARELEALIGPDQDCTFSVLLDPMRAAQLQAYAAARGENADAVLSRLVAARIAELARLAAGEDASGCDGR
jgi:hypothetical protein